MSAASLQAAAAAQALAAQQAATQQALQGSTTYYPMGIFYPTAAYNMASNPVRPPYMSEGKVSVLSS